MLPSLESVRSFAEAGDLRYVLLLSFYYHLGVQVEADDALSEHWYHKAYKAISAEYLCQLGELRELGTVIGQDFSLAKRAYTEAMALDEIKGAYMLARLSLNSAHRNPYHNRQAALDLLSRAAAQRHVPSQALLLRNGMRSGSTRALGSILRVPAVAVALIRATFDRQIRSLWRYKDVFSRWGTIEKYVGDDRLYVAPRSIDALDIDRLAPASSPNTSSTS